MSSGIASSMPPSNLLAKKRFGTDNDAAAAMSTGSGKSSGSGLGLDSEQGTISRDGDRSGGDGLTLDSAGCTESPLRIEWLRSLTAAAFSPPWVDRNPRHSVPGMVYFPAIGCVVGIWVWLWIDALAAGIPRLLASAGAVMMGTWLTSCRLEDGLANTADAFGGGGGKKEILQIMKDSRVGVYAVVAVSLFLFAKFHALSYIPEASIGPTILVAHVLARWTVLPICYFVPYVAENEDEKDEVVHHSFAACLNNGLLSKTRVVVASVYVFAIAICGLGLARAFIVISGQILLCIGSARYALGVLDGVVGHYLGATIMVSEMLTYLILIADWQRFMAGGWWRVLRLLCVLYPLSRSMAGATKDRAAKRKKQGD